MKPLSLLLIPLFAALTAASSLSTFTNPVLPGWHSDPSCVYVSPYFYCATSTFISFPGIPIYASRDLINWRLISHVWNRESQLPGISWNTTGQQDGMYAPTLRYHDGEWFCICEYLGIEGEGIIGVLFRSKDPFEDGGWSDPVRFSPEKIDPDLFWDDDGKVYAATHGIVLQEIDLETGELSQPPLEIWNGTGGVWPEGPHFYKRDGWYYLLIAEGGTGLDHAITVARAKDIKGPYEAYEGNPILTNRETDEWFQTVGHGDLFQDEEGRWWGMCLATRSGPEYEHYPMGREAVLFNVTWEEGEWPVLEPVRGRMEGWPLPERSRDVPGDGPFNDDPDDYTFSEGDNLPKHWVYWRVPQQDAFTTTDKGLRIIPSRNNLTGIPYGSDIALTGQRGLSFIGRRQTHSLFDFNVELSFAPKIIGQEAGITVFLTQVNHIDLSLVLLKPCSDTEPSLHLRARAEGTGGAPPTKTMKLPQTWVDKPVKLHIEAQDYKSYSLSAKGAEDFAETLALGDVSSALVSGGNGSFVGSLLGAFATCNGKGEGVDCPNGGEPDFQNWKYTPVGQYISEDEWAPV